MNRLQRLPRQSKDHGLAQLNIAIAAVMALAEVMDADVVCAEVGEHAYFPIAGKFRIESEQVVLVAANRKDDVVLALDV